MEPLRLPVNVSDRAIDAINQKTSDESMRLYRFFGATSQNDTTAIGKDGFKKIIDAVFDGREVLNPETDEEFLKRIGRHPATVDGCRLYNLAKKYVELKGAEKE
ncbi:hypothetical protein E4665_14350 [Sporolactobacillus shoreae]|uniref:Uncharacterized protein n=1 Tax=Sporolactobacillus shoreae TaxID=1465501 RepID=A0A4Z0GL27_9BACL|nr:hypothetical protein [Sporolactobacillus shoreae]TGA96713.1 hypothetical protein E4665_14350 [Sporolactobacillus shoreae]